MDLDRTNPETWPYTLTRNDVKKILGVNANRVLEIFHRPGFPKITLGKRLLVTKPAFLHWLENQANKTDESGRMAGR
jgi:hypothetical protein